MVPVTDAQLGLIRTRIQDLSSPSIRVCGVTVEDADSADGPVVLVTVKLASSDTRESSDADATWDADDFLSIRSKARTIAVQELSGQDVRLVYKAR
jgi:hypothetical protein